MKNRIVVVLALLVLQTPAFGQTGPDGYIGDPVGPNPPEGMILFDEPARHGMTAVEAARELYGARFTVERISLWCSTNVPESTVGIEAAKSEWMKEHAQLLAKADRIIQTQVDKQGQDWLVSLNVAINKPGEVRLAQQPEDVRRKWCSDAGPARIRSERFRLISRADIAGALEDRTEQPTLPTPALGQ